VVVLGEAHLRPIPTGPSWATSILLRLALYRWRIRVSSSRSLKCKAIDSSCTWCITVQTPAADCPCSGTGRICVEIYSISADGTRGVAVAIFVCGYALVADRTRRPAVAVAISAHVLTADPPCRIAVPISIGVYGAIAVGACRVARSIRVKAAALGVQRQSGYRQHQPRKNEAPPSLLVRCDDAGR
jgi:hypothetical protein